MMTAFQKHFATYAGTSFARQLALADFLGKHRWNVDIGAGTVDFGRGRTYRIQVLGSESHLDHTWLWAWANEASQLPIHVLEGVRMVHRFGEQQGIRELTDASFPLQVADGHMLSMLSVGLVGACCYYRGPYEGGALFFLVLGIPESVLAAVGGERAVTVINQVISQFDVDHRLMVETFLEQQGFAVEASDGKMSGRREDGTRIDLEFDGLGRASKIQTVLKPAEPRKPWWRVWGA